MWDAAPHPSPQDALSRTYACTEVNAQGCAYLVSYVVNLLGGYFLQIPVILSLSQIFSPTLMALSHRTRIMGKDELSTLPLAQIFFFKKSNWKVNVLQIQGIHRLIKCPRRAATSTPFRACADWGQSEIETWGSGQRQIYDCLDVPISSEHL